jgi:hypothetical protein
MVQSPDTSCIAACGSLSYCHEKAPGFSSAMRSSSLFIFFSLMKPGLCAAFGYGMGRLNGCVLLLWFVVGS